MNKVNSSIKEGLLKEKEEKLKLYEKLLNEKEMMMRKTFSLQNSANLRPKVRNSSVQPIPTQINVQQPSPSLIKNKDEPLKLNKNKTTVSHTPLPIQQPFQFQNESCSGLVPRKSKSEFFEEELFGEDRLSGVESKFVNL